MEFVYNLFLVLHFVGLAMLLGGFIVQAKSPDKTIDRWMRDGALLQFITGILMMGVGEGGGIGDEKFNYPVVGIKLVVLVIIIVLAFIARKRPTPQPALWGIAGALTLLNILVAVFAGVVL